MLFIAFVLSVATAAVEPEVLPVDQAPLRVEFLRDGITSTRTYQYQCENPDDWPDRIICNRHKGRLTESTQWTCSSRSRLLRSFSIKWERRNDGNSFVAGSFYISDEDSNKLSASDTWTEEGGFFSKTVYGIAVVLLIIFFFFGLDIIPREPLALAVLCAMMYCIWEKFDRMMGGTKTFWIVADSFHRSEKNPKSIKSLDKMENGIFDSVFDWFGYALFHVVFATMLYGIMCGLLMIAKQRDAVIKIQKFYLSFFFTLMYVSTLLHPQ